MYIYIYINVYAYSKHYKNYIHICKYTQREQQKDRTIFRCFSRWDFPKYHQLPLWDPRGPFGAPGCAACLMLMNSCGSAHILSAAGAALEPTDGARFSGFSGASRWISTDWWWLEHDFYFPIGKFIIPTPVTNIFQRDWNHQPFQVKGREYGSRISININLGLIKPRLFGGGTISVAKWLLFGGTTIINPGLTLVRRMY